MPAVSTIPDVAAIAEAAFVHAYPLVLISATCSQAPLNRLVHVRDTPDTLRSTGWIDLADEPVVLSVPNTLGRYYALWLRDAWNTVFASLGARVNGTAGGAFAILGPGQHDTRLPRAVKPIAAATRMVQIAGCIEAIGETDDEAIGRADAGFGLVPLSLWGRERPPGLPPSGAAGDPVDVLDRMDAGSFFAEVERLVERNPPSLAGHAALERLREVQASGWPASRLHESLQRGFERGRAAVRAEAQRPPGERVGGWLVGYGDDSIDPLARAAAARAQRELDPATDVLHACLSADEDGRPLSGLARYVLRFAPDETPPVHGFWSLTASAGTPSCAWATSDLRGLTIDPDGSLPIFIQARPPARERRANWLPTASDVFSLALRLYWPREEALQRRWSPPSITRVA